VSPTAGTTLVEVLVALVLTALAAGALAAVAATSGHALVTSRRDAAATTLAGARLEALRAAPRTAGTDLATRAGDTYVRRWSAARGRGRPDALEVTLAWSGHGLALATEVWP
jgi:Tfp pilus assembly protein PilV